MASILAAKHHRTEWSPLSPTKLITWAPRESIDSACLVIPADRMDPGMLQWQDFWRKYHPVSYPKLK